MVQMKFSFAVNCSEELLMPLETLLMGKGPIKSFHGKNKSLIGEQINPLSRPPIDEALNFGVRSIDSFMTIGKGTKNGYSRWLWNR